MCSFCSSSIGIEVNRNPIGMSAMQSEFLINNNGKADQIHSC